MSRIRNTVIGVVLVTSTAMGFTDYEPENMGFQITDLGSINGEVSFANDISDSNQACGQYKDYDGIWKPCVFSSGWPQNIDDVDDAVGAANVINIDGRVAGWTNTAGGNRGFITHTLGLITLPSLGGDMNRALGMNSEGDTVGWVRHSDGTYDAWMFDISEATWPYNADDFTVVTNSFGDIRFEDISENNVIVGEMDNADGHGRPLALAIFPFDLGSLGGDNGRAMAIKGDYITGMHEIMPGSTTMHAFLHTDGTMTDLGDLGTGWSEGLDVNSQGHVVGWCGSGACRWLDGESNLLIDLLPPGHGWNSLNQATGINDNDSIVGWGYMADVGHAQAFKMYPKPTNDSCANAIAVGEGSTHFTNQGADTDGGVPYNAPCTALQHHSDIWYEYTPTCPGAVTFDVCDSNFEANLIIYEDDGTCPPLPNQIVDCTDQGENCASDGSQLTVSLEAGTTYLVRIGGGYWVGDTGEGMLSISIDAGPANDDYQDRHPISDGSTNYNTLCAETDGPVHPDCAFDGVTGNDIWYTYTASCTGQLTVSTCDTVNYDSDLVIYSDTGGSVPTDADMLACNDDYDACAGYSSQLEVAVTGGKIYTVRVGGWKEGHTGSGSVSLDCVGTNPCPGDLDGNFVVDIEDLLALLAAFGHPDSDCDGDGDGDIDDLLFLLNHYGDICS